MTIQKKHLIHLLILIFIGYSCAQKEKPEKKIKSQEINADDLLGAWGGDSITENAYFAFFKDSIYYPDPNLTYKYIVKHDTLIIFTEENTQEKIIIRKISKDSLSLDYLDINQLETYKKRH